ncbi:YvcK family protein [Patescibacteria group bacterium]|nr:YvcK family protein [Patescibacteria group bacterium]
MNQSKSMLRVCVIGGGNGSAKILRGLKMHSDELILSAVIAMSDSGSSNGELRKKWGVMPPADILRATLAMSPYDYDMLHKIFRTNRFQYNMENKHYLGNLFLALSEKHHGDFIMGLDALHVAIEALGKAYPVTIEQTNLCVELNNGEKIVGEDLIDRPSFDRTKKIQKAWLEPKVNIYKGAKEAIEQADFIILSLGSLYTSVIATLLVDGVSDAIQNNKKAKIIYICGGACEADGETGPIILSKTLEHLENYIPRPIYEIIYNNHELTDEEVVLYSEKKWNKMELDIDNIVGKILTGVDMEKSGGGISPEKLGEAIYLSINK